MFLLVATKVNEVHSETEEGTDVISQDSHPDSNDGGPMKDFDDQFGGNLTRKAAEMVREEVLVRDAVWEAMVTTAWQDYISRLHRCGRCWL